MTVLVDRPRVVETNVWTKACRLDTLVPGREERRHHDRWADGLREQLGRVGA